MCALVCHFLRDLACPVVAGKLGFAKLGIGILLDLRQVVVDVTILKFSFCARQVLVVVVSHMCIQITSFAFVWLTCT